MDGLTIVFGFLIMLILVLIGFFIYSRPKGPGGPGEPGEPGGPGIKLMESSAILNPDAKQDTIEGYTIEYSSGDTYTNEELTDYVNIKIKWNNLGGFSMVRRLKLTLENGNNIITPSKVFTKTNTSESKYFREFTTQSLEYTFVGKDVTSGDFIGTIKPVFEYSVSDSGDAYSTILLSNSILLQLDPPDVQMTLDDNISHVKYFFPGVASDFDMQLIYSEPVTLTSQNVSLSNIIIKPYNLQKNQYQILDNDRIYYASKRPNTDIVNGLFTKTGSPNSDEISVFELVPEKRGQTGKVIIKAGDKVVVIDEGVPILMDMNSITDSTVWNSKIWTVVTS